MLKAQAALMTSSLPPRANPGQLSAGAAFLLHQRPPPKSPDYDNVTLEELLEASNCWAQYMNEQYRLLSQFQIFVTLRGCFIQVVVF